MTEEKTELVEVVAEGINSRGFGTIPQAVMRDSSLSVEAKGIYAYICSFAGSGLTAFPSRSTVLRELGISKDRFYRHRKALVDKGLLRIEHRVREHAGTPIRCTVYVLSATLPAGCQDSDVSPAHDECPQNKDIRGEFSTNPSSRRLSLKQGRPQNKDIECPQNKDTLYTVKSNNEKKHIHPSSQPYLGVGEERGRVDGIDDEYAHLSSRANTPNRNRISAGLAAYRELRKDYPADVIASAWRVRQRDAREDGRKARYYPQLASWLEDPGLDGARTLCITVARDLEEKIREKVRIELSIDPRYADLRERLRDVRAGDPAAAELVEREIAELRDEKAEAVRREMAMACEKGAM